jgi:Bacterial regulatory proteins, luxR family
VHVEDVDVPRNVGREGVLPLLAVGVVTVVVTAGFAQGFWLGNLHNGLLGLAFTCVGAYVLHQQPRNRCATAFLATGFVEAVMFLGRQVGHDAAPGTSPWWGWFGVWLLVVGLFGVTVSVVLFPDGRPPTPGWRWVLRLGGVITVAIAVSSALWPIGYASAGVTSAAPFELAGADAVATVWEPLAHTVFAVFQVLWLVAIVVRWRVSGPLVRRQLLVVGSSVAVSVVALLVGLVGWRTPTPGVLTACLVPVAAGWAIVHAQYLATHSALTWLAGRSTGTDALPAELAAAIGGSLGAERVTIRVRRDGRLHALGWWPEGDVVPEAFDEADPSTHDRAPDRRAITRDGAVIGELHMERADPLSRHEQRLLDGYCGQAALVIDHLSLAATLSGQVGPGGFDHLTPRELEVLELMSRGLTNAAICDELHLSKKTVEPVIGSIFAKLGLPPDADSNRRVLAVLAYVHRQEPRQRSV